MATSKSVWSEQVTHDDERKFKDRKALTFTTTKNEKKKQKIQSPVDFLVLHLLEMRTKTDEQSGEGTAFYWISGASEIRVCSRKRKYSTIERLQVARRPALSLTRAAAQSERVGPRAHS